VSELGLENYASIILGIIGNEKHKGINYARQKSLDQ